MKYDFSGWATKNDLRCSDGLTIAKDAFKHNDGRKVPLIWNHNHNNPNDVLGHAVLENRNEGVYAYCTFNSTPSGVSAREMVKHGDIEALSIYANQLQKNGSYVMHGQIREVSLVLAGANPGAYIDKVLMHGMEVPDEGVLFTGDTIELYHDDNNEEIIEHKEEESVAKEKTIQEIIDTMNEEQKNAMYAIVGTAVDEAQNEEISQSEIDEEGGNVMKHNVFNQSQEQTGDVLSHSDVAAIFKDAKRVGSLREAVDGAMLAHGIDNIDFLFPDAQLVNDTPGFIKRPDGWVDKVLSGVHHTPFSRIKSMFANITEDDARAKGYLKGNLKKEEVFSLLKRTTTPTTIYKKQKLDRDDVVDITSFDVVAWLKVEMRMMLNEEIARALLVGDGRLSSSDDKINDTNIRPIWTDEALYTVKARYDIKGLTKESDKAVAFIEAVQRSRKNYRGS